MKILREILKQSAKEPIFKVKEYSFRTIKTFIELEDRELKDRGKN